MPSRRVDDLRDELSRLMAEHIESVKAQTFGGLNETEVQQQERRLRKIREVTVDYLATLKGKSS